ncbi:membrane protein, partial [Xanthomonas oryzae pv. oryzae]
MNVMVPLVVALSGVPALVIAASIGADDDDR